MSREQVKQYRYFPRCPIKRAVLYNQAAQFLVTDVAWIPVVQSLAYYEARSSVTGFALAGLGYPSLDQLYPIQIVKR